MRHNDIMNFTLIERECNDVETESMIHPICGETMPRSVINGDEAEIDIKARGFQRRGQPAVSDKPVATTNTDSAREPHHLKFSGNIKCKRKETISTE